jgi:hypothetical protein
MVRELIQPFNLLLYYLLRLLNCAFERQAGNRPRSRNLEIGILIPANHIHLAILIQFGRLVTYIKAIRFLVLVPEIVVNSHNSYSLLQQLIIIPVTSFDFVAVMFC